MDASGWKLARHGKVTNKGKLKPVAIYTLAAAA